MKSNPLAQDLDHVLAHTEGLWEELRGQRIFITGGTGFFGCWLLESFIRANDKLGLNAKAVVLTRNPEALQRTAAHLAGHPAIQLYRGDVRSFTFPDGNFSHLIHAAADASAKLKRENPLLVLDSIVDGTRHVLDFARHCGTRRFLFTSSGAVYGQPPAGVLRIPEDYIGGPDPMDPRAVVAEGKRVAETLCVLHARQHGLEVAIARAFAFVGPYLPLDVHFAIGNFIRDGLQGGPIVVHGDGTPYRSYLYAADMAIWLWTILLKGRSCHAYNVGSEAEVTIAGVAREVAEQFDRRPAVQIKGNPSGAVAERYVPDTERARQELGLKCFIERPEAIRRTIAWQRTQSGGIA